MTEDEARKKWCPMVRTGLTAGMAVNHHTFDTARDPELRTQGVAEETRCRASDCMMWRRYKVAGHGYCGLAGHD